MVGAYFANWAQYRPAPYTHTPDKLEPIVDKLTHIFYGFVSFCPPTGSDIDQPYWVTELNYCKGKKPYDMIGMEPKDPEFLK